MASLLKVDALTGVTTAGSISVTGEGNSTTTNLQQGLAKSWININGSSGTPATRDSLNISSVTDNSTGRYGPVLTNAMSDTNYVSTGVTNANTGDSFYAPNALALGVNNVITTTTTTFEASSYGNTYLDSKYVFILVHGDLA